MARFACAKKAGSAARHASTELKRRTVSQRACVSTGSTRCKLLPSQPPPTHTRGVAYNMSIHPRAPRAYCASTLHNTPLHRNEREHRQVQFRPQRGWGPAPMSCLLILLIQYYHVNYSMFVPKTIPRGRSVSCRQLQFVKTAVFRMCIK